MSEWTQLKFNMDVPVNVTLQAWGDGNLVREDNFGKPQYFVGDKVTFTASEGLHNLIQHLNLQSGSSITIEKKSSEKSKYGIFHIDGKDLDGYQNGSAPVQNNAPEQPPVAVNQPINNHASTNNVSSVTNNGTSVDEVRSGVQKAITQLEQVLKDMDLPF
tara:strand:+ start:13902 stop:14381 length:480 start_codon:yes stop_codon:yes gene_type:complete